MKNVLQKLQKPFEPLLRLEQRSDLPTPAAPFPPPLRKTVSSIAQQGTALRAPQLFRMEARLEVKNFAPISRGEVAIKPLTVFVGPNSAGKSYVAKLYYAGVWSFRAATTR